MHRQADKEWLDKRTETQTEGTLVASQAQSDTGHIPRQNHMRWSHRWAVEWTDVQGEKRRGRHLGIRCVGLWRNKEWVKLLEATAWVDGRMILLTFKTERNWKEL